MSRSTTLQKRRCLRSEKFFHVLFVLPESRFLSLPFFRLCHGLRNRGPLDPGFRLHICIYMWTHIISRCNITYIYIYTHLLLLPQELSLKQLETWTIFSGKYGFLWPILTWKNHHPSILSKPKGIVLMRCLTLSALFLQACPPVTGESFHKQPPTKKNLQHKKPGWLRGILMTKLITISSHNNWVVYSLWRYQSTVTVVVFLAQLPVILDSWPSDESCRSLKIDTPRK